MHHLHCQLPIKFAFVHYAEVLIINPIYELLLFLFPRWYFTPLSVIPTNGLILFMAASFNLCRSLCGWNRLKSSLQFSSLQTSCTSLMFITVRWSFCFASSYNWHHTRAFFYQIYWSFILRLDHIFEKRFHMRFSCWKFTKNGELSWLLRS